MTRSTHAEISDTPPSIPSFVADLLAAGGELRPAQVTMALLVGRALAEEVHAVIEAGTGTGKTWAYLIPAIQAGKVVIVSTANRGLQEQIFYRDIPLLQKKVRPFQASMVQGVNNYLCVERLSHESHDPEMLERYPVLDQLLQWTRQDTGKAQGDFENLPFAVPAELRQRIRGESDFCAWKDCDFFARCYIRKMREAARVADVIVVNHTLLLLDALLEGALLPERDAIIVDEAHHLGQEAISAFTSSVRPSQVQSLLQLHRVQEHSTETLRQEIARLTASLWERIEHFPFHAGTKIVFREPIPEALRLAPKLGELAAQLRLRRPAEQSDKERALYDRLLMRVQNLASTMTLVFGKGDVEAQEYVRYAERLLVNQRVSYQASAAPLSAAAFLKEKLFRKTPTVIMVSATLATVGPNPAHPEESGCANFAYFRRQVGLDPLEGAAVIEQILPLIFNYREHALLYLPRAIPEPAYGQGADAVSYIDAIAREMRDLVQASEGRAFLLFSSKRMLDEVYSRLARHLPSALFTLLCQGEMNRSEVLRRFRTEQGAILLGLKSFWEGVDIAGEALSLVVIDKLPFVPPDDPVHEAQVNQCKATGRNWFGELVLPEVVLHLKQGVGRLLRTPQDRGVMAILDGRLHTKAYGRQVLAALPPARRTTDIEDVRRFFTQA